MRKTAPETALERFFASLFRILALPPVEHHELTTKLGVEECYRRIKALCENRAVSDEEYLGKAARTPQFKGSASPEGFSIRAGSKESEGISFYGEASGRFVSDEDGTRVLVRLAMSREEKWFLLAAFPCLAVFAISGIVALLARGNAALLVGAVCVAGFMRLYFGQVEHSNRRCLESVIQTLEAGEKSLPVLTELWEYWRLAERTRSFRLLVVGKLLPQARRAVQSLLTPVCREFVTELSPEECRERLLPTLIPFSLTDTPARGEPLTGTVTAAGFSLHLSQPITGILFWPASGRFVRSLDGTHVKVHLGLHRVRTGLICLLTSQVLWLFLGVPNPVGLVAAFLLSAAILSVAVGAREPVTVEEDNELIGLLCKILVATEVAPAPPLAARPTESGLQSGWIQEVPAGQAPLPLLTASTTAETVCPNCHASGCVSRVAGTPGLAEMFPMPCKPSYSPPWAPTLARRTIRAVFERELLPNAMALAGLFLSALVQLVIVMSGVQLEGELMLLDAILLSMPLLFGLWAVIADHRLLKSMDLVARDRFAADTLAWEKASARWRTMLRCQECLHLFLPGQSRNVPEQKISSLLYSP